MGWPNQVVRGLAKPGDTLKLLIDNQVVKFYLVKQGGRKVDFNLRMQPVLDWCVLNSIRLQVDWVPSEAMPADEIGRMDYDPQEMVLDNCVYYALKRTFRRWIRPTWDVWVTPQLAKEHMFISRLPHAAASMVDALSCPLDDVESCYACPCAGRALRERRP